jgi:phosphoglycerate dehydrogenase-like enzyme
MDYDVNDPETGGALARAGYEMRLAPKRGSRSPAQLAELLDGAVGAIVSTDPFDRTVFAAAPDLRVIARVGVGTDSIDLEAATAAGVVVTTTPEANRETTADHALAMILAAVRRIVEHDAQVREGGWVRGEPMVPWDLHRATVGLVGFGRIGRAVARRLRGFGVQVLVTDPALVTGDGCDLVALDDLLARADIVSLHLPLHDATRGLIGRRELDLMGRDAILVNTSRGGLIDEHALVEALAAGRLRAAALDVFADEPVLPDGLAALPNVVLTPHIGGLSVASVRKMVRDATSSVVDVLAGRANREVVANPAVLANPAELPPAPAPASPAREPSVAPLPSGGA